jgi:hypothetical protein
VALPPEPCEQGDTSSDGDGRHDTNPQSTQAIESDRRPHCWHSEPTTQSCSVGWFMRHVSM